MQYLILGANGYVGSYLYRRMKMEGLDVIGTGHYHEGEKSLIYFDILKDSVYDIAKLVNGREKTAIICIAQAALDRCRTEYELSRQINVISIKKVIETLIQNKFQVIYFSTDNVFDGIKGNYTEQDRTNAVNQYGKMKEEVEHYLLEKYPEVCIFRMPRVVGVEKEGRNLLTDLESKLTDKEVRCIKNNRMSIIAKEDIYQACVIASERKLRGIYNLSSGEVYSRKEIAEKFFEYMGVYNKPIIELELEEFGFKDTRPLNTSLNNSKFIRETGHDFITYDMLIEQYLTMNRNEMHKK